MIDAELFRDRLAQVTGLEVSIDTVWRWCRQRRIDARKIGREWRIRESEVERVAEDGTADLDHRRTPRPTRR